MTLSSYCRQDFTVSHTKNSCRLLGRQLYCRRGGDTTATPTKRNKERLQSTCRFCQFRLRWKHGYCRTRVIEVQSKSRPARAAEEDLRPTRPSDYPHVAGVLAGRGPETRQPAADGPAAVRRTGRAGRTPVTEEEAGVVRHWACSRPQRRADSPAPNTARWTQVEPILRRLAEEKRVIAASGPDGKQPYRLLPIMPGMFEMVLMRPSLDSLTDWHRRFAELFEALYETGYMVDYRGPSTTPWCAILPVGKAIEAHPMALPSDQLEVVLDQFDVFAVGQCQCRIAAEITGHGCDKPKGNCAVMGRWAKGPSKGLVRQVEQAGNAGHQARGRGPRHGQLDHERGRDQEPVLLFVLRLLLPRHAVDQRVQRAGALWPRRISCPAWTRPGASYAAVCPACPMGAICRRHAREDPAASGRSDASAAGCAPWPAKEAGDRHGASARLQAALQELVCLAQPGGAEDADDGWKVGRVRT